MLPFIAAAGIAQAGLQNQALLDDLSHRAFQFFWDQSNASTGFTKDRAANLTSSDSYNVASIAATGYSLAAYALAPERGWKSRSFALARAISTVNSVRSGWPKQHGWFYHFVDWQTGQRVWESEASTIDTSIFIDGMLMAEREFKDSTLTASVNAILGDIDWNYMVTNNGATPNSVTICHGWKPETGFLPYRWDSYSEELMLYIQALGSYPAMPEACWSTLNRPWIDYQGYTLLSGGPLFMHEMSYGFLDFSTKRDPLGYDYWAEGKYATLANRKFCMINPHGFAGYGPNFWGLSASDSPDGYSAFGAPGWGGDNGTITPTAAIGAVMFTPGESIALANNLYTNYRNAYGRYGFSNAINPTRSWTDPDVIGIDLGMMMMGIENARNGLPQRLSMSHAINQQGFKRVRFKDSDLDELWPKLKWPL